MGRSSSILLVVSLVIFLILTGCTTAHAISGIQLTAPELKPASTKAVLKISVSTITPSPLPTLTPRPTPTLTVTAPSTCHSWGGSLESGEINTKLIPKPMRYTVYLPPCYAFDQTKRFPVLYLLHGQGFTEDQWIRIGAVSSADRLIVDGQLPPFIIVFPFDYSSKQPREYKFEDVFVQLLIPEIDIRYRTKTDVANRAIGGLSRGGAWAFHLGAQYPELFGAIGGHSPAIFYNDETSLRRNLLAIPIAKRPRIWLDVGDNDPEFSLIKTYEDFLSKNDFIHEWHIFLGWHDEKYWSAHVDAYLGWYAQSWR